MISAFHPLFLFALIPYGIQGLALAVDEFVLHRRRGLSRWERWGHPLDTLTVLNVNLVAHFFPFKESVFIVFLVLCFFSCLFVTKDEWIHAKECCPFEHWLHAVLFVIHPVAFACSAFFWIARDKPELLGLSQATSTLAGQTLIAQAIILFVFIVYQIMYWNFFRPKASG